MPERDEIPPLFARGARERELVAALPFYGAACRTSPALGFKEPLGCATAINYSPTREINSKL